MRIRILVRTGGLLGVLLAAACAELEEHRRYEERRERMAEGGVILPQRAPLPPVPVF